jgi:DNA-binding IclR family transcriptional regulator
MLLPQLIDGDRESILDDQQTGHVSRFLGQPADLRGELPGMYERAVGRQHEHREPGDRASAVDVVAEQHGPVRGLARLKGTGIALSKSPPSSSSIV